jgi:hypothetical protein
MKKAEFWRELFGVCSEISFHHFPGWEGGSESITISVRGSTARRVMSLFSTK